MNRELPGNRQANAGIDALLSAFSRRSAQDRAVMLIRHYFRAAEQAWENGERLSGELAGAFSAWFGDPRERAAKDRAMDRLIEALDAQLEEWESPGQI